MVLKQRFLNYTNYRGINHLSGAAPETGSDQKDIGNFKLFKILHNLFDLKRFICGLRVIIPGSPRGKLNYMC